MSQADSISLPCQNCGRKMKIPASMAGGEGECPGCKTRFLVPSASTWQPVEKVLPRRKSEEEILQTLLATRPDPDKDSRTAEPGAASPRVARSRNESLESY